MEKRKYYEKKSFKGKYPYSKKEKSRGKLQQSEEKQNYWFEETKKGYDTWYYKNRNLFRFY
jgi:hypothetical protein